MELRAYQQAAIDAIYTYFTHYDGNPLVVCPTASGKSVIQGAFIKGVFEYRNQRVLLLSHVKELLEQNHAKVKALWPDAPVGLYSAGLNRREVMFPITVAGIQSVYKKAALFGYISLIIIDEAHLLGPNDDSMYRKFISDLMQYNPKLKIIGLTATPFRMKGGPLTYGQKRIFTDICYSIDINYLIKNKFIAPLISKTSNTQADLTGVRITAGDYNQKQAAIALDQDQLTEQALNEVFEESEGRKTWLVFCASVEHAIKVRDAIRLRGVSCEVVTGETDQHERDDILERLKSGELQAVTNYGVLTTGFDAPGIDLIVLLRATASVGLYIQMLGRGMRMADGKANCKVLDFAGNMAKHGPINLIDIKDPKQVTPKPCPICSTINDGRAYKCVDCGFIWQEIPTKACEDCGSPNHIGARMCKTYVYACKCGKKYEADLARELGNTGCLACNEPFDNEVVMCKFEFPPPEIKHDTIAAEGVIIAENAPSEFTDYNVTRVEYSCHEKKDSPDSMCVTYYCGLNRFREWVTFEHTGLARSRAERWWKLRQPNITPPATVPEALMLSQSLGEPRQIVVRKNGKYFEVVSVKNIIYKTPKEYRPAWMDETNVPIR